MSEEKQEKQSVQEVRGERGELGVATAGLTIKQRWHEEHFNLVDTSDKAHPHRRSYVRKPGAVSLKAFARALVKSGDANAKEWLGNKLGAKDQKRSDANIKAARETAMASKSARKSKKAGGGKKTEAAPTK
jgi:hypothetical protein